MERILPSLKNRLLLAIILALLSTTWLMLLLATSAGSQIQKIVLGTTSRNWFGDAATKGELGERVRVVVFGDSWGASHKEGREGRGKSWVENMCDELNTTSFTSLAASQPSHDFPSLPPTGVYTSHSIHAYAIAHTRHLPSENTTYTLPDLATQIQTFKNIPLPATQPNDTVFVLSLGFWDVYDFARLDYAMGVNATDYSVAEVFRQLDVLYEYFSETLYPVSAAEGEEVKAEEDGAPKADRKAARKYLQGGTMRPKFRVIIPRLFDPTLTPGWLSHRPAPLSPSSVAEQQKNAVYLTERWNQGLENGMGRWTRGEVVRVGADLKAEQTMKNKVEGKPLVPPESFQPPQGVADRKNEARPFLPLLSTQESGETSDGADADGGDILPQKDVYYHDTPNLLLSLIVAHQLLNPTSLHPSTSHSLESKPRASTNSDLDPQISSPFSSVFQPCKHDLQLGQNEIEDVDGLRDEGGHLLCTKPEDFLWWDAFSLGPKGNRLLGKEVAERISAGRGLRKAWEGQGR
ncbi:hypothetical protein PZA11_004052 [Diplocarpon coronariae]|uniref:Uncharacterized protein n=1 Tax=Diplocarpon coronariae TaxID=2795749 RepID=A0A218YSS2_9HELO|nr:hypothetical protein JHW43_004858 [Diplocarpon mali]OWO98213.1 hypothetical protein B2J93_4154 [Marssonina coronariae]